MQNSKSLQDETNKSESECPAASESDLQEEERAGEREKQERQEKCIGSCLICGCRVRIGKKCKVCGTKRII